MQFDALTSFTYNLGSDAFGESTLLKMLKDNPNDSSIRDELKKWVYGGGTKLPGLVRRREAEADLYYHDDDDHVGYARNIIFALFFMYLISLFSFDVLFSSYSFKLIS